MSRSVSTSTLAIFFFFAFFAIFATAAPTNATCGGLETESTPGQDVPDSTNTPNSTVVDDGTGDDSDVVDPNGVNTLAATRSGTVGHYRNRRSMARHAYNVPLVRVGIYRLPGSTWA